MNVRQVVARFQAEMFADRGHLCPNCAQYNAKVSEDWIGNDEVQVYVNTIFLKKGNHTYS